MVKETMDFLKSQISISPKEEYTQFIPELKGKIPDPDDVPLMALAFTKGITVWSNDPHFQQQTVVKVLTTDQLIGLLKSYAYFAI
jgi:predicted nucleic acid-binding protein